MKPVSAPPPSTRTSGPLPSEQDWRRPTRLHMVLPAYSKAQTSRHSCCPQPGQHELSLKEAMNGLYLLIPSCKWSLKNASSIFP